MCCLSIRNLKKGGYNPAYERVETAAAMKKALKENRWDIILCDYKMPKFSAPSAISVLKEANIDIPLIIVTGTIGEETAAECMRLGAHDYIMKGNLSRLCPAIARELKDAEVRNKGKQIEENLGYEQRRFRAFVEHSSDIIVLLNLKGIITYVNPAVEKIMGFKPEERIGANGFELIHPDDIKFLTDSFNTLARNTNSPIINGEMHLRHKDGSWRTLEAVGSNLVNNNVIESIVVNYRDITKRKQAEKDLQEREDRFRRISYLTSDIAYSCRTNEDGIFSIDWMIGAAEQISGYSIEEIKAENCWRFLVLEEDMALFEKNVVGLEPGSHGFCELRIRHKNGGIVWIASNAECFIVTETPEQFILHGALVDITERKKTEKALQVSEARYRLISENTADLISILDMNLHFTYVSPASMRLRGFTVEEAMEQTIEQVLTPESLRLGLSVFEEEMKLEALGTDDPNRMRILELEEYKKDGSTIWVEVSLTFLRDKDDKPTEILTVTRDITERKQAEESVAPE